MDELMGILMFLMKTWVLLLSPDYLLDPLCTRANLDIYKTRHNDDDDDDGKQIEIKTGISHCCNMCEILPFSALNLKWETNLLEFFSKLQLMWIFILQTSTAYTKYEIKVDVPLYLESRISIIFYCFPRKTCHQPKRDLSQEKFSSHKQTWWTLVVVLVLF